MVIYKSDKVRVLQHELLDIWNVQVYGECDNPRSYGRHYDWYTVKQLTCIREVKELVKILEAK